MTALCQIPFQPELNYIGGLITPPLPAPSDPDITVASTVASDASMSGWGGGGGGLSGRSLRGPVGTS